jgi:hypothetical protein
MFTPTRDQARQFLFETWRKYRAGEPLEGLETVALEVLVLHPEYHAVLDEPERFLARNYQPEEGQTNPFLHLGLHIAIEEQLAIDQPPGIRTEFERLLAGRGDRHDALHAVLDCLGEVIWRAQRDGVAPEGEAYLECLRREE